MLTLEVMSLWSLAGILGVVLVCGKPVSPRRVGEVLWGLFLVGLILGSTLLAASR